MRKIAVVSSFLFAVLLATIYVIAIGNEARRLQRKVEEAIVSGAFPRASVEEEVAAGKEAVTGFLTDLRTFGGRVFPASEYLDGLLKEVLSANPLAERAKLYSFRVLVCDAQPYVVQGICYSNAGSFPDGTIFISRNMVINRIEHDD